MDGSLGCETFEASFDGLFDRAYRLAYRLVGHPELAEDVAAEALARAFAHWPRISRLEYRDAWVLRVATNLALDALRRKAPDLPLAPMGARQPDEAVVLRLALGAALRSLPRRQRQTVALRYLAELSADEVAEALRISPGSVKTHVYRGLTALRSRLGSSFAEEIPNAGLHAA
jgi:RNA polymerase sigma factor (sigma-70 family)